MTGEAAPGQRMLGTDRTRWIDVPGYWRTFAVSFTKVAKAWSPSSDREKAAETQAVAAGGLGPDRPGASPKRRFALRDMGL